jgi:hypothetical protein
MRKRWPWLLVPLLAVSLGGALGIKNGSAIGVRAESDTADTQESQEIKATILEAYRLYDVADRTLDVSGFDEVLVNEPSVPLTEQQADRVYAWFGQFSREKAGYLTYVRGCYLARRDAGQPREGTLANARTASQDYRSPSDDVATDAAEPERPIPTPPPSRSQPQRSVEENVRWREAHFRFLAFHIDGDRATVLYEDVVTLSEATLVRRGDRWYLAGVRRIRNLA